MISVHDTLTKDHRRCDNLFATAEEAASSRRWALDEFHAFRRAMERHFSMEEGVLFPAFQGITGTRGPTEVTRMEHAEMRGLMEEMEQRILRRDAEDYLGLSETLLILMQQHYANEDVTLPFGTGAWRY